MLPLQRTASAWLRRWWGTGATPSQQGPLRAQQRQIFGGGSGGTVAVGLSGGVDSAVAALRLRAAGVRVVGVFMRNWDGREEAGGGECPAERDLEDARRVAGRIGIPLHEVDFVAEYWTRVFDTFVEQHGRGLTPNPDLDCNRHIKFQSLLQHVLGMGADALATGHYARLRRLPGGEMQLLRGADRTKDQSYFLASVSQQALQRSHFPLGHLTKAEVRRIAAEAGLHVADKKGSTGICFIGKRPFGEFIGQYVEPRRGRYVSVEDGRALGAVPALSAVTHGQGARISGQPERWFVAGKDVVGGAVHCAPGSEHPALFTGAALLRPPFWVAGRAPPELAAGDPLRVECKVRYGQAPATGTLCRPDSETAAAAAARMGLAHREGDFAPSRFCRLEASDMEAGPGSLQVRFHNPLRAVTPQQACVFYSGEVCLGGALIATPGRSLYEQEHDAPTAGVQSLASA